MRRARAASARLAGSAVAVGGVKRVVWFHAEPECLRVPISLSVLNNCRMCRVLQVSAVLGDYVRIKITACARPGSGGIVNTIRSGIVLIDQ